MPNYVRNILTIKNEHRSSVVNGEGKADFNILLPMPPQLENTSKTWPTNEAAIYAYASKKDRYAMTALNDPDGSDIAQNDKDVIKTCREMLQTTCLNGEDLFRKGYEAYDKVISNPDFYEMSVDDLYDLGSTLYAYYTEFGAFTGIDWAINNWGTKWNAISLDVIEDGENTQVVFDTAWCAPVNWLHALESRNIPFTCEWENEDYERGIIAFDGKKFTETELEPRPHDEDDD